MAHATMMGNGIPARKNRGKSPSGIPDSVPGAFFLKKKTLQGGTSACQALSEPMVMGGPDLQQQARKLYLLGG